MAIKFNLRWAQGAGLILAGLLLLAWRSNAFWDALSPVTHKTQLYALAGEAKVDPLLLAAIIKAESGFNPFASSKRGAMGLMQLLPETAAALAAELKIDYSEPDDLFKDDLNLRLGTWYFSKMLKAFKGNLILALAAYNAGPSKVNSWRIPSWGMDQAAVVEAIPVAETRFYVRRVLKNYHFLKWLQSVKRLLRGG